MTRTTFKFSTQQVKEDVSEKRTFSLTIPMDKYIYIAALISRKTAEGFYNYNLKDAFAKGLELLKKAYPNVSNEKPLQRRFYRGGKQSQKIESYSTSSVLLISDINWIDNFIAEKRRENQFFSKTDFIIELVEKLERYY